MPTWLIVVLLGILAAAGNIGRAQERVTPPPTRLPATEDTVQTGREQQDAGPELELPEVLILGEDRAVRVRDEKVSPVSTSLTLLHPELTTQLVEYQFLLQERKPYYQQFSRRYDQRFWSMVQGGTYSSLLGRAGYWRTSPERSYMIEGRVDYTEGQYFNSQHTFGRISAGAEFILSPGSSVYFKPEFRRDEYGLFGAEDSTAERAASQGGMRVEYRYESGERSAAGAQVEVWGYGAESDLQGNQPSTSDLWMDASGRYSLRWANVDVTGGARFVRERTKFFGDSLRLHRSFGEARLESGFRLSPGMNGEFGVTYQYLKTDSGDGTGRLAPRGRINVLPGPKIGISLELYSGYKFNTYSDLADENRYAAHRIILAPDEVLYGLRTQLELQPAEGLTVGGTVGYNQMEREHFWTRDSLQGLFKRNSVEDVNVVELTLFSSIEAWGWMQFHGEVIAYSALYDQDSPHSDREFIPYRPTLRIPVDVSIRLPWHLTARLDGEFVGARETSLTNGRVLNQYILLGAQLERSFGEHFMLRAGTRNVLNHEYAEWRNYPETGRQWFLGLEVKL